MKYKFIEQHRDEHRIVSLCRALDVSRPGYYAWRGRPLSQRAQANAALLEKIKAIHQQNRSRCGSDKTWNLLNRQGIFCGRHRVARLRREHGIEANRMKRFRGANAARNSELAADNLLNRQFNPNHTNESWVADTTFIPTRQGALFLAIVLDLYARRVVGWAMSANNNRELICEALQMAIARRRPKAGLLHHSDRGNTYTSVQYRELLEKYGMRISMSRVGNCHDNAVAESFFANLKNELTFHYDFRTQQEGRSAIFDYIEVFYNRKRPHLTLNYATPDEYEKMQAAA